MSSAARARRSANTISTGTGATRAPIRCTTRCAGNISTSATTSRMASRPRATPGAERFRLHGETFMPSALATLDVDAKNFARRRYAEPASTPDPGRCRSARRRRGGRRRDSRSARSSGTATASFLTRRWSSSPTPACSRSPFRRLTAAPACARERSRASSRRFRAPTVRSARFRKTISSCLRACALRAPKSRSAFSMAAFWRASGSATLCPRRARRRRMTTRRD